VIVACSSPPSTTYSRTDLPPDVPDHLTLGAGIALPCPVDEGWLVAAPEGDFVAQGSLIAATRPRCAAALHATAGAEGSSVRVGLVQWGGAATATLRVLSLGGAELARADSARAGTSVTVDLPRSGEYLVRLDPADPEELANPYQVNVTCVSGCDREFTRYPILLMHGFAGTDAYLPQMNYFYNVVDHLAAFGFLSWAPAVDAFNSVESRSVQWQAKLDELESFGLARRFNLVAHSQGGLDSRFLIGVLLDPRPVALITLSTPHRGTAVADLLTGVLDPAGFAGSLVDGVFDTLSRYLGFGGTDLSEQLNDLSRTSMSLFNSYVRDVPGVYYASWAGRSCGPLDHGCQDAWRGETCEPFLQPTFELLSLEQGPNDGMVAVESAIWGEFMGEFPGDHFDEVGQVADTNNTAWNHLEWYLGEARRLASLGF
jgi:triacylglycerol lipase